ncbi:hypothetical protein C7M84_007562 [Penaeus vannamei]|uniref:Uncharacterized protein n=1 Tax=Penaeus vannamei TaxID=6689 RepID=A0A3R7PXG7_PENVA|nr:hypothetical protein C7M84_007562 [Penaeus vannamei]
MDHHRISTPSDKELSTHSQGSVARRYSLVVNQYMKSMLSKSESTNSSIPPSNILTHSADQAGPEDASYVSWDCPDTPTTKGKSEQASASSSSGAQPGASTSSWAQAGASTSSWAQAGASTSSGAQAGASSRKQTQKPNSNPFIEMLGLVPLKSETEPPPVASVGTPISAYGDVSEGIDFMGGTSSTL